MRTAMVGRPAVTPAGTSGLAGSSSVSGPGQNAAMSARYCGGMNASCAAPLLLLLLLSAAPLLPPTCCRWPRAAPPPAGARQRGGVQARQHVQVADVHDQRVVGGPPLGRKHGRHCAR
jgi:hypothetical protein